MIHIINKVSP